ncbi:MAG TPA: hypothetical protein VMG12_37000 [Polyangiaceae bacterium]|nr:hypothetical protein [Polyangiaceae bacterium]
MKRDSMTGWRATLRALVFAAGALWAAGGCGRAESPSIDSETHWLMSCDSDLDCGVGSCEYGVCTETCASSEDCSSLGVAGVECVGEAGAACLLQCADADDCSALGSGAVCESQRCELPASSAVGSVGDGDGASAGTTVLCDGSEDVRFYWSAGPGDSVRDYNEFAASRGAGFLAIDGQCRFWRASGATLPVYSGTLSAQDAASFATLVYDRFAELDSYDDQVPCISGGTTRLWSPMSRAFCNCACQEQPELAGWLSVAEGMRDPQLQALFADAQPLAGPLRLALLGYGGNLSDLSILRRIDGAPLAWPLSRAPAESEIYPAPIGADPPVPDPSWGVDINDPADLAALRATQRAFLQRSGGPGYTPVDYIDPDTQQLLFFQMLLRDELPATIQAALERPLF